MKPSSSDAAQPITVEVRPTSTGSGSFINATALGFMNLASGKLRYSGTPEQCRAALRALVFKPRANQVAPGIMFGTGFTLVVRDGLATGVDSTTSIQPSLS